MYRDSFRAYYCFASKCGSKVLTRIYAYIAAFVALIGGGLGLWLKGRADTNNANALQDAQNHIETRQRMDKADEDINFDDPDVLRDLMRERGRR